MKNKSIIIVPGEQESIFFEIFFKSLKSKKFRNPLILISSKKILKNQMKKNNFKKNIRLIKFDNLKKEILNNKMINLIDINKVNIQYKKQTKMQNDYLKKSFEIAFKILKSGFSYKFINGPVNKSNFLDKKYLGITEYISKNFKIKKFAMLIYNKDLSVCPVTTHLPLKLVAKNINKKKNY